MPAKFGAYRTNRFEVTQILVNFSFSSAAIFGFEQWRFWHFRCLEGFKTKLHAKFGENRTNGLGVIQVFVNFKMAAGRHLEIMNFAILRERASSECGIDDTYQIWCI